MTSYAKNIELTFGLQHLRGEIYQYILNKAGWKSLNQFEMECHQENKFEIMIKDGVMYNQPNYPQCVSENFFTQELSLHHLGCDFQGIVINHLGVRSCTHYEIYHSMYNAIYVCIPYYDFWMNNVCKRENITKNAQMKLTDTQSEIVNNHKKTPEVNINELICKDQFFTFGSSDHRHINIGYEKYLTGMYFMDIDEDNVEGCDPYHKVLLYKPNNFKQEWSCIKYWNNLDKVWECFPLSFDNTHFKGEWDNIYSGWVVYSDYFEILENLGAKYLKSH